MNLLDEGDIGKMREDVRSEGTAVAMEVNDFKFYGACAASWWNLAPQ